jgi:hypothetical protein
MTYLPRQNVYPVSAHMLVSFGNSSFGINPRVPLKVLDPFVVERNTPRSPAHKHTPTRNWLGIYSRISAFLGLEYDECIDQLEERLNVLENAFTTRFMYTNDGWQRKQGGQP